MNDDITNMAVHLRKLIGKEIIIQKRIQNKVFAITNSGGKRNIILIFKNVGIFKFLAKFTDFFSLEYCP